MDQFVNNGSNSSNLEITDSTEGWSNLSIFFFSSNDLLSELLQLLNRGN